MAETKTTRKPLAEGESKAKYEMTWRDKAEKGLPLTELERVKRDAEILTLRRLRDAQEDAKLKAERSAVDSVKLDHLVLAEIDHDLTVKTETKA